MKVLFATDGSSASREGEELISGLFDPQRVTIETLCVRPVTPEEIPLPDSMWKGAGKDVPAFDPERVAEEAATRLSRHGFVTRYHWAEGNPAHEVETALRDGRYDLGVLGASHSSWMGSRLLGSVSTNVLHHAPCSILIGHQAPAASPARILFATDGSDQARAALDIATEFLDPSKCTFEVATVVLNQWVSFGLRPMVPPPLGDDTTFGNDERARIARGWDLVEADVAELRRKGFDANGVVLSGRPLPQILKEADKIAASLVITGVRGLGAIKRTFLGSVSEGTVRHTQATLVGRLSQPTTDRRDSERVTSEAR